MGRFKGGLRCKGRVNSVIREINYRCNYIHVRYQMINLNVQT